MNKWPQNPQSTSHENYFLQLAPVQEEKNSLPLITRWNILGRFPLTVPDPQGHRTNRREKLEHELPGHLNYKRSTYFNSFSSYCPQSRGQIHPAAFYFHSKSLPRRLETSLLGGDVSSLSTTARGLSQSVPRTGRVCVGVPNAG